MLSRIKQYLLIALAIWAFYFLMSHHFIFYSFKDFDLLKKKELTLDYTFYSLGQHDPYEALGNQVLRDAGIENLMLERGLLTEEQLDTILRQIDRQK